MKKQINEIKRMQQLAGLLKENQGLVYSADNMPDDTDQDFHNNLYYILDKLGIYTTAQYMAGEDKDLVSGTDEWMDLLSYITGKNAKKDEFDAIDNKMINIVIQALENMGFNGI